MSDLSSPPALGRWHWPALALGLLALCGAYGYVLTRDLPLLLLLGLPAGALLVAFGLRRPELLTVALLAITWGYVSEALVKYFGLPSVAKTLVTLLVALVLRERFMGRDARLATHPLLWWMLGYFLVVCAGLWYAAEPNRTWLVVIDFAKELLLLFVVLNTLTSERWVERGVWAMLAVGAALGTLALYQEATRSYDNEFGGFARSTIGAIAEGVSNRQRAGGPTGEPNAFGQQMLVLVPVGLWAAVYARTLPARILGGYAAFACLGGAALSFSRGAYLAFIVMLVLLGLHLRLNPRYLLVLPLLLLSLNAAPPELRARFSTLGSLLPGGERISGERDASVERRQIEMLMAAYMFADHPVEGVGADNYRAHFKRYSIEYGSNVDTNERNAHSYYLEIAAEHGLIGLTFIGGIMVLTFAALRRARRQFAALGNARMAELASAMAIGFACYAVTAIFLHGDYSRFLWLQVDLAAAFAVVAARAYQRVAAPVAETGGAGELAVGGVGD
jgi:putative inorganic carbon (HCO3(-)) transporter